MIIELSRPQQQCDLAGEVSRLTNLAIRQQHELRVLAERIPRLANAFAPA